MMIQWSVEQREERAAANYTEIEPRRYRRNNNFCHFRAVQLVESLFQCAHHIGCFERMIRRGSDDERKIEKFHWNVNLMDAQSFVVWMARFLCFVQKNENAYELGSLWDCHGCDLHEPLKRKRSDRKERWTMNLLRAAHEAGCRSATWDWTWPNVACRALIDGLLISSDSLVVDERCWADPQPMTSKLRRLRRIFILNIINSRYAITMEKCFIVWKKRNINLMWLAESTEESKLRAR